MPDLPFDVRLLRHALAAAEYGSFRRAAAALNVQQSTVSRSVRSLEYRVGAELFERGHSGVRPTQAGDRFLEEATLGFDHLRRAMRQVGAMQRGEHGELTVGVSIPFVLFGKAFEQFRAARNGVLVEIVESTSSAGLALVRRRRVDVAFVAKPSMQEATQSLHLGDEPMVAVLPKAHPLARGPKVELDDLGTERFILSAWGMGPDIEEELLIRMARHGLKPQVQLHRVDQGNLTNMVALGLGVTIAVGSPPPATVGGVVLVPLAPQDTMSMHAVWMESNPNPALGALVGILRQTFSTT